MSITVMFLSFFFSIFLNFPGTMPGSPIVVLPSAVACLSTPSHEHLPATDISHNFCRSATKFGNVRGLANRNLFPEFRELWSGGSVIPCGDMHQPFADTLVKRFFDNFPMFADGFSVLSIHCVARGLGESFLYKRPASRGGSL